MLFYTFFLGLIVTTLVGHCYGYGGLKFGYYKGKCGKHDVEKLIYNVVKEKIAGDPDVVSDLVRISFHDCFVRVRIYLCACYIVYMFYVIFKLIFKSTFEHGSS